MGFILFDEAENRSNLLPLTFTRPVCEIRIGLLTIREKWEWVLKSKAAYLTQDYLSKKFPLTDKAPCLYINGKLCPTGTLMEALKKLGKGQALYKGKDLLGYFGTAGDLQNVGGFQKTEFSGELFAVEQVWDIFRKNGEAIQTDFEIITLGKKSKALSETVTVIGDPKRIFLEEGAKMEACIVNVTDGYVYIGRDAEVMEGSIIRGPLALCEHSTLKMGSKIYGPTTIGPHCKVGGEVSNSVIFGYSNKAHDGFLGNSVIGEWCNLGADTNNSNLKNNYGPVKLFNYTKQRAVDTGLQFCGLIMGDHSKAGINTMFNTGTVVGVAANIYGGGFPPTYIPSFSWGGAEGFETYLLDKLAQTAAKMFERRGLKFDDKELDILGAVFEREQDA